MLCRLGLVIALPLFPQTPTISSVTNSATLAPMNGPGHALAPGSIGTIFGQDLATTTASAQGYPLPDLLGGTSVTVDGVSAPLFYVSPGQINFQVPYATIPDTFNYALFSQSYGHVSVIVSTAAGASSPFTADTLDTSVGIFTMDGSGCGQGAILNIDSDGTLSLNSTGNSAEPGQLIAIYATGFGLVYNSPPDGSPALANPLSEVEYGAGEALFDGEPEGGGSYEARVPGLVGVDQANVAIPFDVRQGCAVPMTFGGSQPVLISIYSGGGQCVDPPIGSEGQITITKSVVLNDSTIPESDTLTASFPASPGRRMTLPPVYGPAATQDYQQRPVCPIPGYTTLNAGLITLAGPNNLSVAVSPTVSGGVISYQGTLPVGAIEPGAFQLGSAGGPDIGTFQTTVTVGAPIQITSQFPAPGSPLGNMTVNWAGGQAGETVTLAIVEHELLGDYVLYAQAPATAGTVAITGFPAPGGGFTSQLHASSDVEMDIEVGPDPTQPQIITIPGLTLGALVSWKYRYRVVGLSVN